jgi:hypothetical protein
MKHPIQRFYEFLEQPLVPWTRVALALAVVPLLLGFTSPLWRITLTAPQYPDGLYVDVLPYTLVGGHGGQDLQEINTINHYIGMHHIDRASLSDLDWIPFALGILAILTLRVAAIGNVRSIVDLAVGSGYVLLFAFARFYYRLYTMGHDLSPEAPFHVQPFTPPVFGSREIANFTSASYPQRGSFYVGAFLFVVLAMMAWNLFVGRRRAARADKASETRVAGVGVATAT